MTARRARFDPPRDFARVRDFLAATIRRLGTLFTWDVSRWNYARHFVVPHRGGGDGIAAWEGRVGLWEAGDGSVAGVVNGEVPTPGTAFLQLDPRYADILDDMVAFAEERHAASIDGRRKLSLPVHDPFHDRFADRLAGLGFQAAVGEPEWMSERPIAGDETAVLPPGFTIRSMVDVDDVEARRAVLGLSFDHVDPAEWASVDTYRELQRAPDYRRDLDLFVVAPDGRYAACCIAWYDPVNRVGTFEPVGTHPDFRRLGLGRAVIMEGILRLHARGATKVWVGSGQAFYEAIDFRKKYREIRWYREW